MGHRKSRARSTTPGGIGSVARAAMDYAPTLKALSEKRFELDLEGETIAKLKAAMQEQLHRLQIEERQLIKQLEGDPAAGAEWMLRMLGPSALPQRQPVSSTAALAAMQPAAGGGAAVPALATDGAWQSASHYGQSGGETTTSTQRRPDTLAAATAAAAAAAAAVVDYDDDDDDDDDDVDDDMGDDDDDDDDDDMGDDDDDDDESRQRLHAELRKLLGPR